VEKKPVMGRWKVPQPLCFTSWLRGLWPDRNPLRRTCDRTEAAIVAGLAAALLLGVPLVALSVGRWSYGVGARAQQVQAAWRQVPAVLLTDAPHAAPDGTGSWRPRVLASWAAPDGTQRAGRIPASVGVRAGTVLRVWVDASGRLTGMPLQQRQVDREAALATLLASLGLALVLLGAGALARCLLNWRRLAAWDAAWRAAGPGGPGNLDARSHGRPAG
jgi:hypothetical protein